MGKALAFPVVGGFLYIIYLLMTAVAGVATVQVMANANYAEATINRPSQHAQAKHPEASVTVNECLNQFGPMFTIKNPMTGRTAKVCKVPGDKWGVKIVPALEEMNKAGEVTSFVKDKMKTGIQVLRYLWNRGYTEGNPLF
jgi:hypothetical protein